MNEDIRYRNKCEKHGLDIISVSGHYPDEQVYCEECHVDAIKRKMKGHSKDTIARWIHKNVQLLSDTWPSDNDGELYTLDELKGVTFNDEFYEPIIEEKRKLLDMLDTRMKMDLRQFQLYWMDKYGEEYYGV